MTLINAYDTTTGKVLRAAHRVDEIIKVLHLNNGLTPTSKEGVYVITKESRVPFSAMAFPQTLQTHTRQTITVYDERPFRDNQNRPVNTNDITAMKLCAYLQQDVACMKLGPLKTARMMTAKAFADSLSIRIGSRASLDITESTTLKTLLAFYVTCLIEQQGTDLTFVGENVIRSIYGQQKDFILGVIENVPHLGNLEDLLKAIHANPILYKLKSLGLKDFIQLAGSLVFTGLGPPVVAAAAEAPCLLVAFVYTASRFKALNKTPLGMSLDPKYNKNILESFWKNIDYTYDLNR